MKRPFCYLTLSLALVACGGGGGDNSSAAGSGGGGGTGATTFALDTAQTNLLTTPRSYTATATNGADTFTMFLSLTPSADATFEGVMRRRATQTLTIRRNGATVAASTFENFFQLSPWQLAGAIYSDGTYAVATTANPPLPNSATVGSSGSLGTLTLYSNSSKSTVVLRQDATWTLEADTATSAWLCTNTVARDSLGVTVATTNGCFRIDSGGNPLGIRWTISVDGTTLTFR